MNYNIKDLLNESDSLLLGLLSNALIGVYVIQDGRFVFVNQRLAENFGYTSIAMCSGLGPLDLTDHKNKAVVELEMRRRVDGEANASFYRFQGVRKDGTQFDAEVFGVSTKFKGRPAIVGILADITEKRNAERAVADQLRFIEKLINTIPNPIFFKDDGGNYMGCNTAFEEYIGIRRENLIGKSVYDISPKELADKYYKADNDLFEKRGRQSYEAQVLYADGTNHDVVFFKSTFNKADDTLGGLVGTLIDITERKKAEAALREKEYQYRLAIETSADGFCVLDLNYNILEVNDSLLRMTGFEREEMLGLNLVELEGEKSCLGIPEYMRQAIKTGGTKFEVESKKKDGTHWHAQFLTTFSPTSGGRFFTFISDLTERKTTEDALKLAAMVYENSSESILVSDSNNHIIAVNPSFEQTTGYLLEEIKGKNPCILKSDRNGHDTYSNMWACLNANGYWRGEIWNKSKNGEEHAKLMAINTIKNEAGEIFRYVAMFSDITERKKFEEAVWRQANYDQLTELPNRHMFYDSLEQHAKRSKRANLPMALMLIDLDRFKEVNDALGHDKGDSLLLETARRINACVRDSDTVARLGGDEFAIILDELTELASVERIALKIIQRLNEPFHLDPQIVYVSASIGISIYPMDSSNLDILFKNADQAMYLAKNEGRNTFRYFTVDLQEAAENRLRLTRDLRLAIEKEQFCVYYQPIVRLRDGNIVKAEALIRWQHPDQGLISPTDFIPLAEDTSLIVPIGDWVFTEAVKQAVIWRQKVHKDFQISVNKSPVQLRAHARSELSWIDYLSTQGVSGQCICIEITEGLLLNVEVSINEKLLIFQNSGLQFSIDDFGTGYSSLSYLQKFHFDYLKIDRSFVQNLGSDANDHALCEAIIAMAHKLGFEVIAEGVETEIQISQLMAMGCDYAQGYLFSKPLPPNEIEPLLLRSQSKECSAGAVTSGPRWWHSE